MFKKYILIFLFILVLSPIISAELEISGTNNNDRIIQIVSPEPPLNTSGFSVNLSRFWNTTDLGPLSAVSQIGAGDITDDGTYRTLTNGTFNGINITINGGVLNLPDITEGSVLFAGPSGVVSENNSNFFWDNVNGRLGIGTDAPTFTLEVVGNAKIGASDQMAVGNWFSSGWASMRHSDAPFIFGYGFLQNSAGTHTILNALSGGMLSFRIQNAEEMTMEANELIFNNGATDTRITWFNNGEMAFQVGATNEMKLSNNFLDFQNPTTQTGLGWGTAGQLDFIHDGSIGLSMLDNKLQGTGATVTAINFNDGNVQFEVGGNARELTLEDQLLRTNNNGVGDCELLWDVSGEWNLSNCDFGVSGNVSVFGDLNVTENLIVEGDLNVTGNINVGGNINTMGNITVGGGATFWGNGTCGFFSSPLITSTIEVCDA